MQQPGLFDAPPRLFTCTPSKLGAYEDCPRRYRFTLRRPAGAAEGPAVGAQLARRERAHRAEELVRPAARAAHAGRAADAAEGHLGQRGLPGRRSRSGPRSAGRWAGWRPTSPRPIRPTSRSGSSARSRPARRCSPCPAGSTASTGAATELVIVDYKTGRGELTSDDARGSRALALYAYSAAAHVPPRVPPGRAAPPAHRHGRRARAHRGVAGPAPAPGRRHRPRRDGRRAGAGRRRRPADEAFPAGAGPVVRLVRLPARLPGGRGGGAGEGAVGGHWRPTSGRPASAAAVGSRRQAGARPVHGGLVDRALARGGAESADDAGPQQPDRQRGGRVGGGDAGQAVPPAGPGRQQCPSPARRRRCSAPRSGVQPRPNGIGGTAMNSIDSTVSRVVASCGLHRLVVGGHLGAASRAPSPGRGRPGRRPAAARGSTRRPRRRSARPRRGGRRRGTTPPRPRAPSAAGRARRGGTARRCAGRSPRSRLCMPARGRPAASASAVVP